MSILNTATTEQMGYSIFFFFRLLPNLQIRSCHSLLPPEYYNKKRRCIIMPDVGTLQVSLVSNRGKRPITDAAVEISSAGEPDKILEVLKTDLSGQTEVIS